MLAERERAEFYEWKGEEGCGSFEGSGGIAGRYRFRASPDVGFYCIGVVVRRAKAFSFILFSGMFAYNIFIAAQLACFAGDRAV